MEEGEDPLLHLYPKDPISAPRADFARGLLLSRCHSELILRGVSSLNRGGVMSLLPLHPKTERRRFLTSFEMTGRRRPEPILRRVSSLNRGGVMTLLQLHPKNFKSLLGEVRRGSFNPFDSKEEISHFVRNDTVGWFFLSFFGVSWEGDTPSHYLSPRAAFARGLLFPSFNSSRKQFYF